MKVGFDFDGTITCHPAAIATLMRLLGKDVCYIVTARCEKDRVFTLAQLEAFGITPEMYTELCMFQGEYDYLILKEEGVVFQWSKLIDFKVEACVSRGIKLLVEDDSRYAPSMKAAGIDILIVQPVQSIIENYYLEGRPQ